MRGLVRAVAYYPVGLVGLRLRPGLEQMPVILEHGGISLAGRKMNENLDRKMKIEQICCLCVFYYFYNNNYNIMYIFNELRLLFTKIFI